MVFNKTGRKLRSFYNLWQLMADKSQTSTSKLSSRKDRIDHLVRMLNYYNNTFARIPLTNLSDVGKTAVMLISSILGYKAVAIFLENEDGQPELLASKGGILSGDMCWTARNFSIEHLWNQIHSPQYLDIATLEQQVNAATAMVDMENILLAVPIIGASEPGEKRTGIIVATQPPADFDADADLTILEIITGLISGALSNCLSHMSLRSANRKLRERENDLKNTLLSLAAAHKRMLTILDSTEYLVHVIDIESYEILYINRFGQELYGDVAGRTCWQVLQKGMNGPCDFCPKDKLIRNEALVGKTYVWEHFNTLNDRWYSKHDRLLHWVDDSLVKLQIAIDITEQKGLEDELFHAHKMEAIGTLAGGIAHDFNNILSAIIGFTELAKVELEDGSSASANLAKVLQASHRAAELVRRILTFSRKGAHKRKALQPYLIVKDSLNLMRASLPTTIEIVENIDSDSGTVWADLTQIHRIIINLCTNALHAMEDETGILKVSLARRELNADDVLGHPKVLPGTFIELSVSDTGCGMDQQTQGRIFEPYFTTKETGQGTGLGLSVVLGVVQDYGGMITVESELGKGTTFHVYFPAMIEEVKTPAEAEEVKVLPIGTESILIVDDEIIIVALHEAVLSSLGYTVTAKTSSEEALAVFKADPHSFDLLLTDQAMPALSGAKLAEEVLSLRPDLPIILCTGYSSTISEEKAMEIGIKKYLQKPVGSKDLARIVRSVLNGK
ncbi:MAG: response regulator [Proteobacteria bacterium]|nr:response regulator [Pseudomonadota bacterium]